MPLLDTLVRTARTDRHARAAPRPLLLSSSLAVLAVAALGLVPAVALSIVAWILGDGEASSLDAVRTGGLLWLGAHGGAPSVGGTTVSLLPLLVPLLLGVLGWRAGRWAWTSSSGTATGGVLAAAGAGGVTYASVVGLVGVAVHLSRSGGQLDVDAVRAVVLSLLGATLALGAGIGHASGASSASVARAPVELRAVGRGAAAAAVALLSCSALVLVGVLCVHADRVLAVASALAPGPAGGVVLALLCAATMPNAVLWTVSYVCGPGFAVGSGTVVGPEQVVVGTLPGYPLLGALPGSGEPAGWVTVLTVLPLLAGVVGGVASARALSPGGWARLALSGAGAGAGAGLALAALMTLSGGAVGPGRMQDTGPLPAAAVVLALTMTVAACAGAVGHRLLEGHGNARLRGRWRPRGLWIRWGLPGR